MSDDRIARGKKIRDEAFGKEGLRRWEELNEICPTHARAIHEYCFGTVWDRPHLDLKFRELIVIAAAAASDLAGEVALHARAALNRGATRDEIIETILQCAPYIGFPKTNHALKAARRSSTNGRRRRRIGSPREGRGVGQPLLCPRPACGKRTWNSGSTISDWVRGHQYTPLTRIVSLTHSFAWHHLPALSPQAWRGHNNRNGKFVRSAEPQVDDAAFFAARAARPLAERGPIGSGWNGPSRISR